MCCRFNHCFLAALVSSSCTVTGMMIMTHDDDAVDDDGDAGDDDDDVDDDDDDDGDDDDYDADDDADDEEDDEHDVCFVFVAVAAAVDDGDQDDQGSDDDGYLTSMTFSPFAASRFEMF